MSKPKCGTCDHYDEMVATSDGRGTCRKEPPRGSVTLSAVWPRVLPHQDFCDQHSSQHSTKPSLAKFEHDFRAQSAERASHCVIPLTIKFDAPSELGPLKVVRSYTLPIKRGHFGRVLDVTYIWHEASGVWAIHSASKRGDE